MKGLLDGFRLCQGIISKTAGKIRYIKMGSGEFVAGAGTRISCCQADFDIIIKAFEGIDIEYIKKICIVLDEGGL